MEAEQQNDMRTLDARLHRSHASLQKLLEEASRGATVTTKQADHC